MRGWLPFIALGVIAIYGVSVYQNYQHRRELQLQQERFDQLVLWKEDRLAELSTLVDQYPNAIFVPRFEPLSVELKLLLNERFVLQVSLTPKVGASLAEAVRGGTVREIRSLREFSGGTWQITYTGKARAVPGEALQKLMSLEWIELEDLGLASDVKPIEGASRFWKREAKRYSPIIGRAGGD